MKINSKLVYAERIDLIPSLTSKYYVLAKGRPNGVLEIVYMSLYASGDDKIKNAYRVMKVRGIEARIDNGDEVASGDCKPYDCPIYLTDNMEIGIVMVGEKFDSPCQIFIQYLWHIDDGEINQGKG